MSTDYGDVDVSFISIADFAPPLFTAPIPTQPIRTGIKDSCDGAEFLYSFFRQAIESNCRFPACLTFCCSTRVNDFFGKAGKTLIKVKVHYVKFPHPLRCRKVVKSESGAFT